MRALGVSRTSLVPGGVLAGPWVRDPLWRRARAVPSLDLRFADNKSLIDAVTGASLVTFTRASSGTFVDSAGVLRTAVTNLLLRSEEFDNATWARDSTVVTANQNTAPNGTLTADKVAEDTSANFHAISQYVGGFASGAVATLSIYAKAAGRTRFRIQTDASGGSGTADFDLSTVASTSGTGVFTAGSIQAVGDGWYRCSVRCTTSGAGSIGLKVLLAATSYGTSYTGDGTSGIYLWGAQLEQSSTVGEYIPTTSAINSAPRFDHNPTTGESLGLLVEEQRTNSIRNNTMVGAVAGTPGTLPTNWGATTTGGGLTRQIVEIGTVDGINYIRFRITGTTNASSVFFNVSTFDSTAASTGQTWTVSAYYRLQAGSLTGVTLQHELARFGPSYLGSTVLPFTLGSGLLSRQRYSLTSTVSDATLTGINYGFRLLVPTNGTVVDFTVDIGLPQLEQGAFATSPILTSTAAVTRSADVASITGANFSSWYRQDEGTVFADVTVRPDGLVCNFDDGSFNNRKPQIAIGAGASCDVAYVTTGSTVASFLQGSTSNQRNLIATAYATDNYGFTSNGATPAQDSLGAVPSTVTTLRFGRFHNGIVPLYGTIRRLVYWGQRLANSTLQGITS